MNGEYVNLSTIVFRSTRQGTHYSAGVAWARVPLIYWSASTMGTSRSSVTFDSPIAPSVVVQTELLEAVRLFAGFGVVLFFRRRRVALWSSRRCIALWSSLVRIRPSQRRLTIRRAGRRLPKSRPGADRQVPATKHTFGLHGALHSLSHRSLAVAVRPLSKNFPAKNFPPQGPYRKRPSVNRAAPHRPV